MEGKYPGNSHQRSKARKSEERIAEEVAKRLQQMEPAPGAVAVPTTTAERSLTRSSIEAYVFFIFGGGYAALTAFGIPVNFYIGVILSGAVALCACHLLWKSPWTMGWNRLSKSAGTVMIVVGTIFLTTQGYSLTHRPAGEQTSSAISHLTTMVSEIKVSIQQLLHQPASISVNIPPNPPPKLLANVTMDSTILSLNGVSLTQAQRFEFPITAGIHGDELRFINSGPGSAKDVLYGAYAILVEGANSKKSEESGFATFKSWWPIHQKDKHPEVWLMGEKATSLTEINLTDKNITDIAANKLQYYIFAALQWTDGAGRHQYEFCINQRELASLTGIRRAGSECVGHSFVEKSIPKLAADKRLY